MNSFSTGVGLFEFCIKLYCRCCVCVFSTLKMNGHDIAFEKERVKRPNTQIKIPMESLRIHNRIGKMIRMIYIPFKTVNMLYMYDYGFFYFKFSSRTC